MPKKELTRKQISRAEREARNTRILLLSVGGAVALAILLIGFGILRESVLVPNEPVVTVGNQSILTREFQQRVRLERLSLIQEYNFYQNIGLQDNAAQALQQLNDRLGLGSQVISALVDEALYRQAAPELGVSVSADDVQKTLEEDYRYFRVTPTPEPTLTPLPTPTASATITVTPQATSTPAPTATPVTLEAFNQLLGQRLDELSKLGIAEADYRRFIEGQLISNKVQQILARDVLTMTDQARFQYIGASSPEEIDQVQQAIAKSGFEAVYDQVLSSTFSITTVTAIEFPYTPKDDLVGASQYGQRFADAVFSTPISGTFGVISDTGGLAYYVGRVLDRGVRELTSDGLQRAQSNAIQKWLTDRRALLNVQVLKWDDRVPGDPALTSSSQTSP
jgi:hypothetical protein